ncbi:hypothetical protein K7432_016780 [Basidiobolus ranarum]|uniref:Uncharacterized protein n=1 Tax=Basidiobolus ranarum TaxID=34480 RepID=A0ABR2WE93_9FUNG
MMAWLKLRAVLITLAILPQLCFSIDTTQKNRRRPTYGLPDWSQAGYLSGRMDLPDDSMITLRITKEELQSQYQVIPDDGQDDSAGLQKAIDFIKANHSPTGGYNRIALIELPSGQIDISQQIYVDASWLLIRGQGTDPSQPSSTRISFKPNSDTIYDTLSPDGSRWDPDSMLYSQVVTGSYQITAKGGWIWPGRGVFRVQYRDVAPKFQSLHEKAPPNRKDLLEVWSTSTVEEIQGVHGGSNRESSWN